MKSCQTSPFPLRILTYSVRCETQTHTALKHTDIVIFLGTLNRSKGNHKQAALAHRNQTAAVLQHSVSVQNPMGRVQALPPRPEKSTVSSLHVNNPEEKGNSSAICQCSWCFFFFFHQKSRFLNLSLYILFPNCENSVAWNPHTQHAYISGVWGLPSNLSIRTHYSICISMIHFKRNIMVSIKFC